MRLFGYPYNDLVICKDSPDYLPIPSKYRLMRDSCLREGKKLYANQKMYVLAGNRQQNISSAHAQYERAPVLPCITLFFACQFGLDYF